jgi:hypothetical protein
MQVRPMLAPSEYKEAAVLIRSKYFWLKFIGANWYATTICIIVVVAFVNSVIQGKYQAMGRATLLLLFGAALIGYSWYRYTSSVAKAFEAQNSARESLSLESDGVHITAKGGATVFLPWSGYSSWKEGKSVFLVKGDNGSLILPCDDISRKDIQTLLNEKVS